VGLLKTRFGVFSSSASSSRSSKERSAMSSSITKQDSLSESLSESTLNDADGSAAQLAQLSDLTERKAILGISIPLYESSDDKESVVSDTRPECGKRSDRTRDEGDDEDGSDSEARQEEEKKKKKKKKHSSSSSRHHKKDKKHKHKKRKE